MIVCRKREVQKLSNIHDTSGCYKFIQLIRTDKTALYKQFDKDENRTACYEVFRIKTRKELYSKSLKKVFPCKELYPKNEDFGYSAWSIHKYEEALKAFSEIELHGRMMRKGEKVTKVHQIHEVPSKQIA